LSSTSTLITEITSNPTSAVVASGSSAGDPYVFPLNSEVPVKLPNQKAVYRMFGKGSTFINASVVKASPEHSERITQYGLEKKCLGKLVVDGYFYDKFFISVEGKSMVIDLQKKTFKGHTDSFSIGKPRAGTFKNGYFSEDNFTVTVGWKTSNKETFVDILFFQNPQIENGIRFRTTANIEGAVGMLIDNYKPKLMRVPKLTTCSYDKIKRRLKSKGSTRQYKGIIMKNEIWKRE